MSEITVFERCSNCNIYLTDNSVPQCERCSSIPVSLPAAYISELGRLRTLNMGPMNVRCPSCGALHWKHEKSSGTLSNPVFESCCKQGKVDIPLLREPPQMLRDLFDGNHEKSAHFLKNIRQYNAAFAFTSFGARSTNVQQNAGGVTMFQAHGELYHLQGPIDNSNAEQQPSYAQLYIYDPEMAASIRSNSSNNHLLDVGLTSAITEMLHNNCENQFVRVYRHAHEILSAEARRQIEDNVDEGFHVVVSPQMRMELIVGSDRRTQNLPTANEIAAIIPNEYSERSVRDIIITFRNNNSSDNNGYSYHRIHETHAAYMPLHYVLLFPRGDYGWNWGLTMTVVNKDGNTEEKRLPQRAYYRFRLHLRETEFSTLFHAKRLFQQYVVDAFAICDQTALNWIRSNQSSIRADVYNGVADAVSGGDYNLGAIGQIMILPSSYSGGPRFMSKLFQDAMAIVRELGKPSLFITFTANPQWIEIQQALLPGQCANDRPDIVARVFNIKVKQLLKSIKGTSHGRGIFGNYKGLVRTIEYQKRGLPHLHLLLFLDNQHGDFSTSDHIDQLISAELPDRLREPELYEVVSSCMMHGPCGALNPQSPCMITDASGKSVCSKNYPKQLQPTTIVNGDGYPTYRRRVDGRSHTVALRHFDNQPYMMDNTWVVPYNPYLSKKYKAHINVEVCASVRAIKYINKYIYKGSDQTTVEMSTGNDEIKRYLDGRYISPVEAVWRLMEFPMHEEFPSVYQLPVHLPGEQPIVFDTNATPEEIAAFLDNSESMLMGYFSYYAQNQQSTKYLYQDFPVHFTWDKSDKRWKKRKSRTVIGRITYCNPNAGERYYLRLLLTSIPGPTSYLSLRTVNGVECSTFREACVLHHLIQDDQEWVKSFDEAKLFSSGSALRAMFTSATLFGELNSPLDIWNKFKTDFCDDLQHRLSTNGLHEIIQNDYVDAAFYDEIYWLDYGLYLLGNTFNNHGKSLSDINMPEPQFNWSAIIEQQHVLHSNPLIQAEKNYNLEDENTLYHTKYNQLNESQKAAFDRITQSVSSDTMNSHFFVQGPAGTGKTFLYTTLCHYYRGQGKIVLCVASSGIAALLLPGGRTSHSRFHIPLLLDQDSICCIKKNTNIARLIQNTSLIIWDEVPMQHRYCFEAVDRTLRDICDQPNCLFGGIPVVLGGDFAQIPPVVVRGQRADIVAASLMKSFVIWSKLKVIELTQNMRLNQLNNFDEMLSRWIGEMSYNNHMYGQLKLPEYIQTYHSELAFIENIYPTIVLQNPLANSNFFNERAILCARNVEVEAINKLVGEKVSGDTVTLLSEDKSDVPEGDPINSYPIEYLHAQNTSGLPPHKLVLKVGMPVMLLRNINPERGLCNGTRLKIHRIGQYVLWVSILGAVDESRLELIPRFTLSTLQGQLPFILTRKQFPVKVCFAMTINKSQGQSLKVVGVDLRTSAFTHGHLYVALSRSTSANGLTVLLPENKQSTENVVFPELLLNNNC